MNRISYSAAIILLLCLLYGCRHEPTVQELQTQIREEKEKTRIRHEETSNAIKTCIDTPSDCEKIGRMLEESDRIVTSSSEFKITQLEAQIREIEKEAAYKKLISNR